MLVLSRRHGEKILINRTNPATGEILDQIMLQVVRLNRAKVRIGIDAPEEYEINRTELVSDGSHGTEAATE